MRFSSRSSTSVSHVQSYSYMGQVDVSLLSARSLWLLSRRGFWYSVVLSTSAGRPSLLSLASGTPKSFGLIPFLTSSSLQLARELFYRSIPVHNVTRIALLYRTLSNSPELADYIRRLSISIPSADSLVAFHANSIESPHHVDSEGAQSPAEALRSIFHSLPQLSSLRISGFNASFLFAHVPLSTSLTTSIALPLRNIHLQSIVSLELNAGARRSELTAKDLRLMLLNLRGLTKLLLVGYESSEEEALELEERTSIAQRTRSTKLLPLRARTKLATLSFRQCSVSPHDMQEILGFVAPAQLRRLEIIDFHQNSLPPTLLSLSPQVNHLLTSVVSLRIALFNYSADVDAGALVDGLLVQLDKLEKLDLGGSTVSSNLLQILPSTIRELGLFGTAMKREMIVNFLDGLRTQKESFASGRSNAPERRVHATTHSDPRWETESRLRVLEVRGGGHVADWRKAWEIQRRCWEVGVVWKGDTKNW